MKIVTKNPNIMHWDIEYGYQNKTNKNSYPMRIFNAKPGAALHVSLRRYKQDCLTLFNSVDSGFRIYLHMPGEMPIMSRHSFLVNPLENVKISITATLITSSDGLRSYNPIQRKCFFNADRQLRFFKFYTQNNCDAECLANFTQIHCGCVRFSMPSIKIDVKNIFNLVQIASKCQS